ncbi:MAG: 3-hydroxyacyl-CoA dehydrogenase family protein [Candidatus Sumerlaeota bacterium]
MQLNKVGVVGAGTSGKGIIRTLAGAGLNVVFCEQSDELVQKAMHELDDQLEVEISKWGVTAGEKRLILSRIEGTSDRRKLAGSQIVIEATAGDLQDRQKIFEELDALFPKDAVLLSNCATICISEIARKTKHPERIAGMHFTIPVHLRPVVEIVRGRYTSDEAMEQVRQLAKIAKKKPIEVLEMPGLITMRVMVPYINEAMHIAMEGLVGADEVDEAVKLAFKLPAGPLAMADRIGLDTLLKDMERLFTTLGLLQYRPCPILRRMVRMGYLGVKSGRGFYRYDEHGRNMGCASKNLFVD